MNIARLISHVAIPLMVALGILTTLWAHDAQAGGVVGPPCDDGALRPKVAGGGLVTFNCGGPATITVTDILLISQSITIDGGGIITLSGGFATSLFSVTNGVTLTLRNIVLDSTFSNDADGGAIFSQGALIMENSTIQFGNTNLAHSGGAIYSSGPVFITNSTLKGNHSGSGGALSLHGNARAQISDSIFRANLALNPAFGEGGAVWADTGVNLGVADSQFVSNSARYGGALYVAAHTTATLSTQNVLSRSTFIGNIVTGTLNFVLSSGGAIFSLGSLNVNNVRFAGNLAGGTASGGGAIYSESGILNVLDSNFDDNTAGESGGAIVHLDSVTRIDGSHFARNNANQGGAIVAGGQTMGPGSLDVSNSEFDSNHASGGGAIYIENTPISISASTFTYNAATDGGAITQSLYNLSVLSISRSTFMSNTAAALGGALYQLRGFMTLTDVTVSGNAAAKGGSIALFDTAHLNNVTVARNTSQTDGGGIYFGGGATALTDVTLSGNAALRDGGGIFIDNLRPVVISLNNVTISRNLADSDNNASGDGGGIRTLTGTVTVHNSIIAGNFDTPNNAGGGALHPDCSGSLVSPGYNLVGVSNGCFGFTNGVNGDIVGTSGSPRDPRLGPLANNGGATWTHALLPGSPAFNAGNPLPVGSGGFACAATDQRGVKRPLGPRCDMGAYEAGAVLWLPFIRR